MKNRGNEQKTNNKKVGQKSKYINDFIKCSLNKTIKI